MAADRERVVAIDVGGTTLKGAVVNRRGRAVAVRQSATRAGEGPEAVIEAVLALAEELVGGQSPPLAVGLAVPGLVDDRARLVREATNLGWRGVKIGALAEERLGLPVAVSHDVRAGALAEGVMGSARGCRDYLLLTLGTGVGAAVVIGGHSYTGAHGLGGELGHVAVEPRGPLCGCGGSGCLEALASAGHIAARYSAMRGSRDASFSTEEVARRAADGEPAAGRIWREALDALALAIANYATLLDPERVVIGGGMARAGAALFDPLRERVAALHRFGEPAPIVAAKLGEEAGRFGAAIVAWRAAGLGEDELATWDRRHAAA
jgi:glucokinase